jgi:glycosyltransferase involved in cell wall biosynthesis
MANTRVLVLGPNWPSTTLGAFEVRSLPMPRLGALRWSTRRILRDGFLGTSRDRSALRADGLDDLYRNEDEVYLRVCDDLLRAAQASDIIIFYTYNPFHPEMLMKKLSGKTLVLGFTDDPFSTFARGVPYLPFVHAAFYISPSYSPAFSFPDFLQACGCKKFRWLPLVQPDPYPRLTLQNIIARDKVVTYVGNPTGTKVDRLRQIKRALGDRFEVYGRWPLRGYYGYARLLLGESPMFTRVSQVTARQKLELQLRTKIGLNMHVSPVPRESGNMRTYEAAACGMMLLSDRGAQNLQSNIFAEGTEAIYYDSIDEAVDLIQEFSRDDERRARIALASHERFHEEYIWHKSFRAFLESL